MKLFWTDVETTGLSPEDDAILALGIVVTDHRFNVLDWWEWHRRLDSPLEFPMAPAVAKMHEASGLIANGCMGPNALSLHQIETQACEFVHRHLVPGEEFPPMCGNSVHFDRAFIAQQMPSLLRYYSHRNLDVSSVRLLARASLGECVDFPGEKPHTPVADLRRSIEELKHWRRVIGDWQFKEDRRRAGPHQ